jgi:hypothetical protein
MRRLEACTATPRRLLQVIVENDTSLSPELVEAAQVQFDDSSRFLDRPDRFRGQMGGRFDSWDD